tara:strand:- start:310 stop:3318 length:3009 start_codon:yes stop_codon:yes gene_type:complete
MAKGLEAQKQYTTEIRNMWAGGILSYISLFTSVRNEERTSIGKYIDDMESKFNGQNVDKELVAHLRYHLLTELPTDEEGASNLFVMEQLGTVYDLYETLIATLLKSLDSIGLQLDVVRVIRTLKELSLIEDARLAKLAFNLTGIYDASKLNTRSCDLSDKVIINDKSALLKIIRTSGNSQSPVTDIWDYIYLGFWLSLQNKHYRIKGNKPHKLPHLLGRAMSEHNMLNEINSLIKLSVNYYGLNIFTGIKEFLSLLLRGASIHPSQWSPHLIGLHSDYLGIEDVPLDASIREYSFLGKSDTTSLWMSDSIETKSEIDEFTLLVVKNMLLLTKLDIDKSLQSLPKEMNTGIPFPYRLIFTQMKLFALSKERKRPEIINLVNETVPTSSDILDIVTFEEELADFNFEDFNSKENILSAPIALFVTWLKTEDNKLLSYLRIATKQAIKKFGVNKPSEIKLNKELLNIEQLIFFLDHICVPQVIDNLRALRGTKVVLNERQDICRQLVYLDPIKSGKYKLEIESIDDDLQMEEGKRVVDRTRIYVDMDAHTRWMLKELKEDYERYKDLLDINISGEQNFKEIFEDFLNEEGATKTTFIPDNEADAVLLSIIARASNDFLTNPKYGLDYYLSKRIRHQSFIGLIRSHLEFSHLVTTRVSEGDDFEYNSFWVDKFSTLNQYEKNQLNELMASFAKHFDDELINVRDNIFQLNTEDCPSGLIKIDFNIHIMSLLKHFIIETNSTFEEFVYYSNIFMWAFLQPSLEKTKQYIQNTLKHQIMHSADKLKATARKLAGQDPAFENFELELTDKTAAVQRSLEDVMSWFTPLTGVSAERVVLSVDKTLNLSTKAALDMLKPFDPKLTTAISNDGDVKLQQQGLTFVNDTIFILLDNIKSHSGLKNPEIRIKIIVNDENNTLTITCSNNTKQSERARLKNEIDKIKNLIDKDILGDRAKLEGRSGFIKLAASIDKKDKGKLNFDLAVTGEFCLSITNDLGIRQEPIEDVRVEDV